MKRHILTGAPGAGKTAVLRALEVDGYAVVEEAATDVIALEQARGVDEPWTDPAFPDRVCRLQRQRQTAASALSGTVQFFDRSPICTLALALHLGHPVSAGLERELERIEAERVYQRQVFLIDLLGFITPTAARRIGLDEAVDFERLHRKCYRDLGYDCIPIPPAALADRVNAVKAIAGAP